MLSEIIMAGVVSLSPIMESTAQLHKYEMIPTTIYASRSASDDTFFNRKVLYFPKQGNNYSPMEDNSTQHNSNQRNLNKILELFKSIISDSIIDFDENTDYFRFLLSLRNNEELYNTFLRDAFLSQNVNVCNAISLFLSQKKHIYISPEEESFIIAILKVNNSDLQEFALHAILNWDDLSDINAVKDLKLANRYLQEDLDEFIQEKK